jgi:hypothetical protein
MTEREMLAYFAGIVDGEGYIGIIKTQHKYQRSISPTYVITCSLEMTHEPTVREFAEFFGLAHGKRKTPRPKRKQTYWSLAPSKKAERIITALLPFLRVKREAALLALQMQASIRNTKRGWHTTIPADELVRRDVIHARAKVVNTRGVPLI